MLIAAIAGTIGGARVSITNQGVSDVQPSPNPAFAGYRLTSSGEAQTDTNDTPSWTRVEDWIRPTSAAPGSYEVRATLNSGTLTSGTTGSWLALSTTREWTVERTLNGISSANLTIEIRRGTTVLDSATVTLTAERTL
jgi:hypothetical protein